MKSINIIIPYFGSLPNYFQLFLNSCKYNPTINWTILTDCKDNYNVPNNVKILASNFKAIQERIHNAFDFTPVIDSVHKLCEYKPAYGFLFPELIEGYDYWGYGDIDLIYGNLRHFLTEDILSYDKIFQLGHFTLLRNDKKINEMFMQRLHREELYKIAFSSSINYNFDEKFLNKPSIDDIFEENNCSIWKQSYAADIYTRSSYFFIDLGDGIPDRKKKPLFIWNDGKLIMYYEENRTIKIQEFSYIHLQKRKMKVQISSCSNCYKIIPNEFTALEVPVANVIKNFKHIKKKNMNFHCFRIRFKNLIAKLQNKINSKEM